MQLYTHPVCLQHDAGEGHPESPARLAAVLSAIEGAGLSGITHCEAPLATSAQLLRAHSLAHIAAITDAPVLDRRAIDADTLMNAHSAEAALRAAGAVCAAIDRAMSSAAIGDRRAFCATRPPGHHATRDRAMGFCLFNSIAVGAAHALTIHRLERVAIVDFDVHHGNGTQDIFWNEPRVLYTSSHQGALYPGSGRPEERGVSDNIINVMLPAHCDSRSWRRSYEVTLLPALDAFRPQLVLVSAGFDGHHLDPLAQFQLESEDFAWLTRRLLSIADRHAAGRLVSTLEGGYSLTALAECSVAHLGALLGPNPLDER